MTATQEKYERGLRLLDMSDRELSDQGLMLLKEAYSEGSKEAGYELASLPGHIRQERSGLTKSERIALLEEQAMSGEPAAALTLAYEFGPADYPADRLSKVLKRNEKLSVEVRQILARKKLELR